MHIILFDNKERFAFYPFCLNHELGDLKSGILKVKSRWALFSGLPVYLQGALQNGSSERKLASGLTIWVSSTLRFDEMLWNKILSLSKGCAIRGEMGLIAGCLELESPALLPDLSFFEHVEYLERDVAYHSPWDIIADNGRMIETDFNLLTRGRESVPLPSSVRLRGTRFFMEQGSVVEDCFIDASSGPVYIGSNSLIMGGSALRGPFSLGQGAVIKMGGHFYGGTSLGDYSVSGGEIKNAIIGDYSNKAHDGYLGDSMIGSWCNIGAGTITSNLKNTGGNLSAYFFPENRQHAIGLKGGLLMGDYSRTAIGTRFMSGSVIGLCCHVFSDGIIPKLLRSFTWGISGKNYRVEDALRHIERWKKMKGGSLNDAEIALLRYIFASPEI